jgi:hypothetical protein
VPGELVLAVPTADLSDWIAWLPIDQVVVKLAERTEASMVQRLASEPIPDRAIPNFRLPKRDEGVAEES